MPHVHACTLQITQKDITLIQTHLKTAGNNYDPGRGHEHDGQHKVEWLQVLQQQKQAKVARAEEARAKEEQTRADLAKVLETRDVVSAKRAMVTHEAVRRRQSLSDMAAAALPRFLRNLSSTSTATSNMHEEGAQKHASPDLIGTWEARERGRAAAEAQAMLAKRSGYEAKLSAKQEEGKLVAIQRRKDREHAESIAQAYREEEKLKAVRARQAALGVHAVHVQQAVSVLALFLF
jgi:hypothetical protein